MLNQYKTQGGVEVEWSQQSLNYHQGIDFLLDHLDTQLGALFASGFEYPGRYTCWDLGFYNPPLVLVCKQNDLHLEALNSRGEILLNFLFPLLTLEEGLEIQRKTKTLYNIKILKNQKMFSEEERSRQPSVFSLIRWLLAFFKSEKEEHLGLYGAFGFDLIYQFEELLASKARESSQREMVLYLPDEIYLVNHRKEEAFVRRYDFAYQDQSTKGLPREGSSFSYQASSLPEKSADHAPGEYADLVNKAKERFACGDLFEVVLSQTFFTPYTAQPSTLFSRMRLANPSPYGFFINLGEGEYLVGASPEMYVRVQGKRVETCPISGTIKRGSDAMEDASNIQTLLDSSKEESELTMCTDVDRNDKSRICEPGSVQVIGRRQIEMYSRVIHTVDHVEGILREGFDAVDAFLTHMWVVTVTGAPKIWAMNFIEQHEKSPRKWYAGAVGWFGFNGNLNTGLVLRTVRIEKGIAEVRVGATLLYDSMAESEEQETRLKASAFLELLQRPAPKPQKEGAVLSALKGQGKKVLLIDHQDSFVHTLANYFRQTGAEVSTLRFDKAAHYLKEASYDLVVLSPGPGKPSDFHLSDTIAQVLQRGIPLFGVCLGLQGIVEYFGGVLGVLDYPMHGKTSIIKVLNSEGLFAGLGTSFKAGRYHSLYAKQLPPELLVTARSEEGIVMAISHRDKPVQAVQFHPETILSLPNQAGLKIINNLMEMYSS